MNFFFWIEKGIIAGSSFPINDSFFEIYRENGVKTILNLTGVKYPSNVGKNDFKIYELPITDYGVPSKEYMLNILKIIDRSPKPVVAHCQAGCGRTGLVLAIWLIATGKAEKGKQAIKKIKSIRACALESNVQERFVEEWDIGKKLL